MYVMLSLMIGTMFFDIGDGQKTVSDRLGLLFYVATFVVFMSISVVPACASKFSFAFSRRPSIRSPPFRFVVQSFPRELLVTKERMSWLVSSVFIRAGELSDFLAWRKRLLFFLCDKGGCDLIVPAISARTRVDILDRSALQCYCVLHGGSQRHVRVDLVCFWRISS